MKKMMAMLLTGAMVLSLAACGNDSSGSAPAESSSQPSGDSSEAAESGAEESAPVTLNVTTTFAGEDTNAQNYQDAIAAWQNETGRSGKSSLH